MLGLFSVHTDECTYHYYSLLAVIGDLTPDNIQSLHEYLKSTYKVEEMELLELIDIDHFDYNGADFKDHKDHTEHLVIQRIEHIGK